MDRGRVGGIRIEDILPLSGIQGNVGRSFDIAVIGIIGISITMCVIQQHIIIQAPLLTLTRTDRCVGNVVIKHAVICQETRFDGKYTDGTAIRQPGPGDLILGLRDLGGNAHLQVSFGCAADLICAAVE